MPATKFICPDQSQILINQCLKECPKEQRCMFLPTLRSVANSSDRKLSEPSVTELIAGTRETYLKKTMDYAVDPQESLYALHGSAVHRINEDHTDGNILSEVRLKDRITSGQFDLYGQIMDETTGVLGDIKVTSSYKITKALGMYKVDVPTNEVYKSGLKKGLPKTRKEWRHDGNKGLFEWSLQLNYYRILLERTGFTVNRIVIQALCRDYSLRIATERGVTKPLYLIPIPFISDQWVERYMNYKAKVLEEAFETQKLPPVCRPRERWYDRKCLKYCSAKEHCPYAQRLMEEQRPRLKEVA